MGNWRTWAVSIGAGCVVAGLTASATWLASGGFGWGLVVPASGLLLIGIGGYSFLTLRQPAWPFLGKVRHVDVEVTVRECRSSRNGRWTVVIGVTNNGPAGEFQVEAAWVHPFEEREQDQAPWMLRSQLTGEQVARISTGRRGAFDVATAVRESGSIHVSPVQPPGGTDIDTTCPLDADDQSRLLLRVQRLHSGAQPHEEMFHFIDGGPHLVQLLAGFGKLAPRPGAGSVTLRG